MVLNGNHRFRVDIRAGTNQLGYGNLQLFSASNDHKV